MKKPKKQKMKVNAIPTQLMSPLEMTEKIAKLEADVHQLKLDWFNGTRPLEQVEE